MNNYTQGTVLGAATMLPATAATGLVMFNKANTWIIAALLGVTMISLVLGVAMISRYVTNRRNNAK